LVFCTKKNLATLPWRPQNTLMLQLLEVAVEAPMLKLAWWQRELASTITKRQFWHFVTFLVNVRQFFDKFVTSLWQFCDNFVTILWQFFDNFLTSKNQKYNLSGLIQTVKCFKLKFAIFLPINT
jgi:hypothetical protein